MTKEMTNTNTPEIHGIALPALGELSIQSCEIPASAVSKVWGASICLLHTWTLLCTDLGLAAPDLPAGSLCGNPFGFGPETTGSGAATLALTTTDHREALPLDMLRARCTEEQAIWLCQQAHDLALWSQRQRKTAPSLPAEHLDALLMYEQAIIHELNGYHDNAHLNVY